MFCFVLVRRLSFGKSKDLALSLPAVIFHLHSAPISVVIFSGGRQEDGWIMFDGKRKEEGGRR